MTTTRSTPRPAPIPTPPARPMPGVNCWVDLFDLPSFRGDRRRFFGPARLDASLLGLQRANGISLRVGDDAGLKIERSDGESRLLRGGESIDSLETRDIVAIEVRR